MLFVEIDIMLRYTVTKFYFKLRDYNRHLACNRDTSGLKPESPVQLDPLAGINPSRQCDNLPGDIRSSSQPLINPVGAGGGLEPGSL